MSVSHKSADPKLGRQTQLKRGTSAAAAEWGHALFHQAEHLFYHPAEAIVYHRVKARLRGLYSRG